MTAQRIGRMNHADPRACSPSMTVVSAGLRMSTSQLRTVRSRLRPPVAVTRRGRTGEIQISTLTQPSPSQIRPLVPSSRGSGGLSPEGRRRRPDSLIPATLSVRCRPTSPSADPCDPASAGAGRGGAGCRSTGASGAMPPPTGDHLLPERASGGTGPRCQGVFGWSTRRPGTSSAYDEEGFLGAARAASMVLGGSGGVKAAEASGTCRAVHALRAALTARLGPRRRAPERRHRSGTPTARFSSEPMTTPTASPPTTSRTLCAPRYTRASRHAGGEQHHRGPPPTGQVGQEQHSQGTGDHRVPGDERGPVQGDVPEDATGRVLGADGLERPGAVHGLLHDPELHGVLERGQEHQGQAEPPFAQDRGDDGEQQRDHQDAQKLKRVGDRAAASPAAR